MSNETQDAAAAASAPAKNNTPPNPLERRMEISVPIKEVDADVEKRLLQIARTARMAGFRPGKVPLSMVRQQHGGQARAEAIGAVVERMFAEQAKAQGLRVAGYPHIEPRSGADASSFEFTAVFEVFPDVAVGDVSGQALEKPVLEVTDAEVDKAIEALRKQRSTFAPKEPGPGQGAAEGDRVTIDFVGRKNGEEFEGGKAEDFAVLLGAGAMLPDFEAALFGVVAGEEKVFEVNFPADYHAAHLAGQKAEFTVKVKKVDVRVLPPVDAEFAKGLGVKNGDLAAMRDEVKSNLAREVKKRLQARIKAQVMDALLAATPIDAPQTLVAAEAQQMVEGAKKDMAQRGFDPKGEMPPFEVSWFKEQATRRVKLGLLLAELVKSRDLHAKPEQVRGVVDEFAAAFEDPQEVTGWYYSQPDRLADAEALVMENNVVEWVLSQAKVTEKPVSFDELMNQAAA